MTKKRETAMDQISLDGLLEVDFLLKQLPDVKERILKYEIQRRERSILLLKGNIRLMRLQTWSVIRSALWTGLTVFFLIVALGQVKTLVQSLQHVSTSLRRIPAPLAREMDLGAIFDPVGTLGSFADSLPTFTLFQATLVAIIAMLVVLGFKGYLIFSQYQLAKGMKRILLETLAERAELEKWLAKSEKNV